VIDTYDGTQASDNPTPEKKDELGVFGPLAHHPGGRTSATVRGLRPQGTGLCHQRPYIPLDLVVNMSWDRQSTLGGPDDLAIALAQNTDLKALVVHGYHDLNTNYLLSRYVLEQSVRAAGRAQAAVLRHLSGWPHVLPAHEKPGRARRRCPRLLRSGALTGDQAVAVVQWVQDCARAPGSTLVCLPLESAYDPPQAMDSGAGAPTHGARRMGVRLFRLTL